MTLKGIPESDALADSMEVAGANGELFEEHVDYTEKLSDGIGEILSRRVDVVTGGNGGSANRVHYLFRVEEDGGWLRELCDGLSRVAREKCELAYVAEHPESAALEWRSDFDSSNVSAYAIGGHTLYVRFHGTDGTYIYFDVPGQKGVGLQNADSKGGYVNRELVDAFDYLLVPHE